MIWICDEYKDAAQTVERLRTSRRDARDGVCSRIQARKPAKAKRPEFEIYSFSVAKEGTRALHRLFARDCDFVNHGSYFHELRRRAPSKTRLARSLFVREGAVIQVWELEVGTVKFATVLHIRRWPFLLLPALAALLLCLSLTFCGPVPDNAPSALGFLQGMTQTEGVKSEPVLSVEYASYASTPDSTLAADSLKQHLVLSLPANCKEGGNPIASAPTIYIDTNGNGSFEPDELVYNPDGGLLKAGTEVSELEFTQPVPAGSYSALTRWDSVLSSDHSTPAGCATFKWVATFE